MELRPIGLVRSPRTDPATAPKQGDEGAPEAAIAVDPEYGDGLSDLRAGEEAIVLTWLDRARRDVLSVHPRDDPDRPLTGVFSTRSADRPNPIGLHQVRIAAIDGLRLTVHGLEAVDGTPVLDLKPLPGAFVNHEFAKAPGNADAGVRIRAATEADVGTLFDLIVELAKYEKLADRVVGDAEVLRRSLFEQRAAEALLIEEGEEAIGYAIFFTNFSTFECRPGIWLEDVYVRPDRRRGGIGRRVMEHLARLAAERGYARLEWCALEWNEPALRFYERLGATKLDDWRMLRLERDGIERLAGGG